MKKSAILAAVLLVSLAAAPGGAATGEVTVKDSVDSTLQHHRQLRSIQENREAAVHDITRAKSGWLPRVDATGRGGSSYTSDSTSRSLGTDRQFYGAGSVGATITQPLWDGLATRDRVSMAEYQVASLDYRVIDNATSLALDAIIAHTNVALRRELLKYAHENVKQHADILEAQQSRQFGGTSTTADVDQIQGRLARARSQLADAQGALLESEENYRRITGRTAPPALENVQLPRVMFSGPESCYTAAQKSNPKLLAFFEDSKRARTAQSLATAPYQPNVNVEVSSGAADRDGRSGNWSNYADAMLVMRWNLFNGGADAASERVAAAQYRQSREDAFNLNDTLRQEVQNTWTRYNTATEQEKFYSQAIAFNTRTRDGFMEQFLVGQRSLLDVLDASSELFNSSTQQATARANIRIAAYTMNALSGDILTLFNIDKKSLLRSPG